MKINPFNLKKSELQQYMTGYCKHRAPYQQHPNCFKNEILNENKCLRIGILDIESFGMNSLKANTGIMLTYFIKVYHKNKFYSGKIKQKDLRSNNLDKNLIKQLIKDITKFDKIITYYGSRFDIPYIRTKAVKYNFKFPLYKYILHKDVYYTIKHRFSFARNSLKSACSYFGIKGKTNVNYNHWIKAVTGNQKSLNYVYMHNKPDVVILEKLYDKVNGFEYNSKRSI